MMLVVLGLAVVPSMATVYKVGDAAGWGLGVDYGTWATGKTFIVGDSLVFNYGSSHNMAEVSSSDYTACSVGNAVVDSSGTTTISLKTAGTHYFICGVIGHCSGGMKLAVPVTAAAGGGGGSTSSPAAPSGGAASQAPPTTTITPPAGTAVPMPSSAGSLSQVVAALFSFVALLFKLVIS